MPMAADDNTFQVLKVGNWYHRRGKLSDLSRESYEKLSDELKLEYVLVRTPEDLGEEVRNLNR